MDKEVLEYINYMRFYIKIRPQSLMFAMMLKLKFKGAQVMSGSPGHCITLIDGQGYDWDGTRDIPWHFAEFPEGYGDSHIVAYYNAIKEKFKGELDSHILELIGSEKARMEFALKKAPTKVKAARICGMSERSFYRKEKQYKLR